jgi:hypothetical protein
LRGREQRRWKTSSSASSGLGVSPCASRSSLEIFSPFFFSPRAWSGYVEGSGTACVVGDVVVVVDLVVDSAVDMSASLVVDFVDSGWDAIAAHLCRCGAMLSFQRLDVYQRSIQFLAFASDLVEELPEEMQSGPIS